MMFQKFHLAKKTVTNTTGKEYDLTTNLRSLETTQVLLHASNISLVEAAAKHFWLWFGTLCISPASACIFTKRSSAMISILVVSLQQQIQDFHCLLSTLTCILSLSCCSCPGVYFEVFEANRGSIIHSLSTKAFKTTSKCERRATLPPHWFPFNSFMPKVASKKLFRLRSSILRSFNS